MYNTQYDETLYLRETIDSEEKRIDLERIKGEEKECFTGSTRRTVQDGAVLYVGDMYAASCENYEKKKVSGTIAFAISRCGDRLFYRAVRGENITQVIGFREDMTCKKESLRIPMRIHGVSRTLCVCELEESLLISTRTLIFDICSFEEDEKGMPSQNKKCQDLVTNIIYRRTIDDIREYFQNRDDTSRARFRMREFVSNTFASLKRLDANILHRILRDENLDSWLPHGIKLRFELMVLLHLRNAKDDDEAAISSKYIEEETMYSSSRRRNWNVRVLTDERYLALDKRNPHSSPFERILPCGKSSSTIVFTVLPNGDDDVDSNPFSSQYDNVMNPEFCANPSIRNITYTCRLDGQESHTVRFFSSFDENVDAEIYFSYFDSSHANLRFQGASTIDHVEDGKKRPLRVHFQWESTANDYAATQLEWLRHIDVKWSYRAGSDVFAPYRYLDPFLEILLFKNHTTSRRDKVAVWVRSVRLIYLCESLTRTPYTNTGTENVQDTQWARTIRRRIDATHANRFVRIMSAQHERSHDSQNSS